MSQFPKKQFLSKTYEFHHLVPTTYSMKCDSKGESRVLLNVSYSIHCFTEEFKHSQHGDHHRYSYNNETRAFNLERYNCSMTLPDIVKDMDRATIYKAVNNNYTYVAKIPINSQSESYSLFFTLAKNNEDPDTPTLDMYVQSAYLKSLTTSSNARNWRFGSLLGQLTGLFPQKVKAPRPKKKAP